MMEARYCLLRQLRVRNWQYLEIKRNRSYAEVVCGPIIIPRPRESTAERLRDPLKRRSSVLIRT